MWGPIRRRTVVAQALRHARALAERERWPVERREALQRERLTELVRHAAQHSPYYREALAGYDPDVGLGSLPALNKATMMEHFDDLVTDRRLRRDALLAHVERLRGDELYLAAYRAMTTSGSSGRKGLFVYDRGGLDDDRGPVPVLQRDGRDAPAHPTAARWPRSAAARRRT